MYLHFYYCFHSHRKTVIKFRRRTISFSLCWMWTPENWSSHWTRHRTKLSPSLVDATRRLPIFELWKRRAAQIAPHYSGSQIRSLPYESHSVWTQLQEIYSLSLYLKKKKILPGEKFLKLHNCSPTFISDMYYGVENTPLFVNVVLLAVLTG